MPNLRTSAEPQLRLSFPGHPCEGRREIVGLGIGPSEAEPFWSAFLKGLVKRGLNGVKLVICDVLA